MMNKSYKWAGEYSTWWWVLSGKCWLTIGFVLVVSVWCLVDMDLASLLFILFAAAMVWSLWCFLRRRMAWTEFFNITLKRYRNRKYIRKNQKSQSTETNEKPKQIKITLRKFHIAPAVDLDEFRGTIKITAPKQTIWKIAPTYRPYRMTIAYKLSCGMSSASMLLYAINSSTSTMSKKQEKSCKIFKMPLFDEVFGRDFGAAFEFSFAQFSWYATILNSHQIKSVDSEVDGWMFFEWNWE